MFKESVYTPEEINYLLSITTEDDKKNLEHHIISLGKICKAKCFDQKTQFIYTINKSIHGIYKESVILYRNMITYIEKCSTNKELNEAIYYIRERMNEVKNEKNG